MIATDDLTRSLADGSVCAFVGAGLSVGAGLPGWYDLIAELSARSGYDLPPPQYASGDALIDAAQDYVNRAGLHSLLSHLKARLDTRGKTPSAAHRALARLPISLVFAANFDDLLERAYREAGKRVEVVTQDGAIPFMSRDRDTVNLVKLYGDLGQPDTIVLAREQYETFFLQRPQMVKLLEIELARSDMLYLGWSHGDPYFKMIFGELLARFGKMTRPGYAVMFGLSDAQRAELNRKHLIPVELPDADRTASLAAWLQSLAQPPAPTPPLQTQPGGFSQPPAVLDNPNLTTGGAMTTSIPPASDRTIVETRLRMARRSLTILETQAAAFTALTIPAHLQIELEEKRAEVAALEAQLAGPAQPLTHAGASSAATNARSQLRANLESAFSLEELATLCFDLDVDFESLPGSGKSARARELVAYLERRGRIPDLLALCRAQRPTLTWE